jgi:hypothetical protein
MRASLSIAVGMTACLASLAVADPSPVRQTGPATVGGFVLQVAAAVDGEPRTLQQARVTLLHFGSNLQFDPSAPLTEAFVARLAADLGVSIQPSQIPSTQVSQGRSTAIAGLMALAAERRNTDGDPLPVECLSSTNRGVCVNCCKGTGATASDCAHFCHSNVPPSPSNPEPQP